MSLTPFVISSPTIKNIPLFNYTHQPNQKYIYIGYFLFKTNLNLLYVLKFNNMWNDEIICIIMKIKIINKIYLQLSIKIKISEN
jgi:hypothetical protein